MVQTLIETTKCFIVLTNTAREAIKQHFTDEQALFNLQSSFYVYLEKLSIEETSLNLTIYFDPKRNPKLAKKFGERVAIIDCVFDIKNGLIAKSFRLRGKNTPVKTNRRKEMKIHFVPSRINGHTYSESFIKTIAELPVAKDQYDYVNKRITSWEGYLKVLYKNASIDDIDAMITSLSFSPDYSFLTLRLRGVNEKQWRQLKGLSAYAKGFKQEIGEVVKVNSGRQSTEIQLSPYAAKLARQNAFDLSTEHITFSNASTKSQLNRLLKGFDRLKEGLSVNPNLENILFEDRPKLSERKKSMQIEFHNHLNEYQREAVTGALESEDIYVIQGPPGTGKTTVISEICYQNVKLGLKTLIASQSNLAVDNALGRLLSNKDIRILRYGRTESIEEEGKKFIEENVATYWKAQTYKAITEERQQQETKEQSLRTEIETYEKELNDAQTKSEQLKEKIVQKKEAQKKLQELVKAIKETKQELAPLYKEREKIEKSIETLQNTTSTLQKEIEKIEESQADLGGASKLQEEIDNAYEKIRQSEQLLAYSDFQQKLQNVEEQLKTVNDEIEELELKKENFEETLNEINSFKKVTEVELFIEHHGIRRGFVLHQLFSDMEKIYQQFTQLQPVKKLSERIENAILYNEQTLNIQVETVHLPPNHRYSIHEVDEFLNLLAKAFAQNKINHHNGGPSIRGLYLRRAYINQLLLQYKELVEKSKIVFSKIKEEVQEQFLAQTGFSQKQLHACMEKKQNLLAMKSQYEEQLQNHEVHHQFIPTKDELHSIINALNEKIVELKGKQEELKKEAERIGQKKDELEKVKIELEHGEKFYKETMEQIKDLNRKGKELEREANEYQMIVKQNPEQELEKTEESIRQLTNKIERIHKTIEKLPIIQTIQNEWHSLLEQSTEHDLNEIRKLYVKHANVIGTTCVASANKEFMDNYPDFDVVIIDEVSKATPPELLLPMLKGKKIILVGDHHQLPPLIGDDTFEETLETVMKESKSFEEKKELEKLLHESLFERLYNNLPSSNKQMLGIQYRMHEKIMKTIANFYDNGRDSLHCGLSDSDALRDHRLTSQYIDRTDHLLWFDVPNEPPYFEQRMKEGASLFNESELNMIRHLLIDLNNATKQAKEEGLMEQDELKSVGAISFYREQVLRIGRLIDELNLEHLHVRTGSVDQFQGMEMDVILLSMVRNNDQKHGSIGFAKDYRRLNVALSRARELLVLIGSSEMFTKRPKNEDTRKMYSNLLKVVKEEGKIRTIHELNL